MRRLQQHLSSRWHWSCVWASISLYRCDSSWCHVMRGLPDDGFFHSSFESVSLSYRYHWGTSWAVTPLWWRVDHQLWCQWLDTRVTPVATMRASFLQWHTPEDASFENCLGQGCWLIEKTNMWTTCDDPSYKWRDMLAMTCYHYMQLYKIL